MAGATAATTGAHGQAHGRRGRANSTRRLIVAVWQLLAILCAGILAHWMEEFTPMECAFRPCKLALNEAQKPRKFSRQPGRNLARGCITLASETRIMG